MLRASDGPQTGREFRLAVDGTRVAPEPVLFLTPTFVPMEIPALPAWTRQ